MSTPRYPLNYDWARLHDWDENESSVSLQVELRGNLAALSGALDAWMVDFTPGSALVDGLYLEYTYEGGCWFQRQSPTEDYLRVWINSSGQDAFDSIDWYAQTLYDAVLAADGQAQILWTELPHRPRHWQYLS